MNTAMQYRIAKFVVLALTNMMIVINERLLDHQTDILSVGISNGVAIAEDVEESGRAHATCCAVVKDDRLIEWAVSRWKAEVASRPHSNIFRSTLDGTWRQVIQFAGGDDLELIGPTYKL